MVSYEEFKDAQGQPKVAAVLQDGRFVSAVGGTYLLCLFHSQMHWEQGHEGG